MILKADVVVVGGGPAGFAAAVGAARLGVHVILLERYGFLGGMATTALVNPFQISKINGRLINRGIFQEVIDHLGQRKACIEGSLFGQYHIAFDHEELKFVMNRMVGDAKIEQLHHVFMTGVVTHDGRITGVSGESKSGEVRAIGRCVIDCTGDGDVAALAGCHIEKGRPEDGRMQPMTMNFNIGGVNVDRLPSREEQNKIFEDAKQQGEIHVPREKLLWFETTRPTEIHFNTTRVVGVDGTNVKDLTKAELEGRHQVEEVLQFLKARIPGYENSYLSAIGPQIGVRETRRVVGEYQMTRDDVESGRKFDDAISCNAYPLDIHNPKGEGTLWQPLAEGIYYQVPYRSLIPKGAEGLLVAGRCISATHEAFSSIRVMPHCMNMGQAAGVAAALAVKNKKKLREISIEKLKSTLVDQGAFIG